MDRQRKATIEPWIAEAAGIQPCESRLRVSSAVLGMVGTLILHSLFLPSILLCSEGLTQHPPAVQDLESVPTSDAEVDITVVAPQTNHAAPSDLLAAHAAQSAVLATSMVNNDIRPKPALPVFDVPDPPVDNPRGTSVQSVAETGDYARLYGIYSGQIQARIDRLWRRPRSPITESTGNVHESDEFHCLVNIIQDARGYVQEVSLPNCNGSSAWQKSLVVAIQQASPLPAPPNPKVFTHSIALSFSAFPYSPTTSADEYEIAGR
jgi:hypothetical protein